MEILIITLCLGLVTGWWAKSITVKKNEFLKNKKILADASKQYSEVLSNIRSGKCNFKSRINKTVYILTSIEDHGNVDVVYMMDKKDIAIFKENKCIYTSTSPNETINDIIKSIKIKFGKEINDTVDVLGITFSKNEFERMLSINSQISIQHLPIKKMDDQKSDIDKIIDDNNSKLSLDNVLDRIGQVGYDNLTKKEKEFLKNHNNG